MIRCEINMFEEEQLHVVDNIFTYNRVIDVAVCVTVWQPTPKTADVTNIAGYVRVRILMNR